MLVISAPFDFTSFLGETMPLSLWVASPEGSAQRYDIDERYTCVALQKILGLGGYFAVTWCYPPVTRWA